jgi:hypothetical protein
MRHIEVEPVPRITMVDDKINGDMVIRGDNQRINYTISVSQVSPWVLGCTSDTLRSITRLTLLPPQSC